MLPIEQNEIVLPLDLLAPLQEGIELLLKQARPGDAILTIGAGNISRASNDLVTLLSAEHPAQHAH